MVRASIFAVVLMIGGTIAAAEPETTTYDLSQIATVVASAEAHVATLDELIEAQEAKLDALYAQRDAAFDAGQNTQAERLDVVIDRLNLTLTELETERDGMTATLNLLREQLDSLQTNANGSTDQ